MAYLVLLKRKTDLENELEAIKIAMSCFIVEQPSKSEYILKDKIREYAKSIVDDDTYIAGWVYDVDGTKVRKELEELLK